LESINQILGKNELQKVIVGGCARMGNAIMNYSGFSEEGIKVVAGFDASPAIIDPEARILVMDLSELQTFVIQEKVKVALLAVPASAAVPVFDKLLSATIEGVLNLTPIPLKSTDECIVHNINIVLELENLFYFIKNSNEKQYHLL
jgi:redox-sensing transcriptional repressor